MTLFIADVKEEDFEYEVTFPADDFEEAVDIADSRGWELIGELIQCWTIPHAGYHH